MERLEGGAERVPVASSSSRSEGMKDGIMGGGRSSMKSDDPFHSRLSWCINGARRSPCVSVADTATNTELEKSKTTSRESSARDSRRRVWDGLVYKERPRSWPCCFFGIGWRWCDTRVGADSCMAKQCESMFKLCFGEPQQCYYYPQCFLKLLMTVFRKSK